MADLENDRHASLMITLAPLCKTHLDSCLNTASLLTSCSCLLSIYFIQRHVFASLCIMQLHIKMIWQLLCHLKTTKSTVPGAVRITRGSVPIVCMQTMMNHAAMKFPQYSSTGVSILLGVQKKVTAKEDISFRDAFDSITHILFIFIAPELRMWIWTSHNDSEVMCLAPWWWCNSVYYFAYMKLSDDRV